MPIRTGPDNWPQLRGADSMGFAADASKLADHWSTTENVAWKTDIAGRGWSSPIVWGDKIFLTTCVNLGRRKSRRRDCTSAASSPSRPRASTSGKSSAWT